jgi:hypothetical protein
MELAARRYDPAELAAQDDPIRAFLSRMSDEERSICSRRVEGLSWSQLARELGTTADALPIRRLARILRALRDGSIWPAGARRKRPG